MEMTERNKFVLATILNGLGNYPYSSWKELLSIVNRHTKVKVTKENIEECKDMLDLPYDMVSNFAPDN